MPCRHPPLLVERRKSLSLRGGTLPVRCGARPLPTASDSSDLPGARHYECGPILSSSSPFSLSGRAKSTAACARAVSSTGRGQKHTLFIWEGAANKPARRAARWPGRDFSSAQIEHAGAAEKLRQRHACCLAGRFACCNSFAAPCPVRARPWMQCAQTKHTHTLFLSSLLHTHARNTQPTLSLPHQPLSKSKPNNKKIQKTKNSKKRASPTA